VQRGTTVADSVRIRVDALFMRTGVCAFGFDLVIERLLVLRGSFASHGAYLLPRLWEAVAGMAFFFSRR
jgi:hypothetical protein